MNTVLFSRCVYAKVPAYRIRTTIERDNTQIHVYKRALTPEARQTLTHTLAHETRMSAYLGERATVVAGTRIADDLVRYPFVPAPTLTFLLCDAILQQRYDAAYAMLLSAVEWIHSFPLIHCASDALEPLSGLYKNAITGAFTGNVACLELALLDLTTDNVLFDQKKSQYIVIDAELTAYTPLPREIVIFRFVFFALARLAHLFDALAGSIPLKYIAGGLLRVPESWQVEEWLPEARIAILLGLEEQLQYTLTGVMNAWPRPDALNQHHERVNVRTVPNVAQRESSSAQHSATTQQMVNAQQEQLERVHGTLDAYISASEQEIRAYKTELLSADERLQEYIAASKRELELYQHELADASTRLQEYVSASEQAVQIYQQELLRTRRQYLVTQRTGSLSFQEQQHTMFWLSGQVDALRSAQMQQPGTLARIRSAIKRRLTTLRTNPRGVARRVKHAVVRVRSKAQTQIQTIIAPTVVAEPPVQPPAISYSSAQGQPWPVAPVTAILVVDELTVPLESVIEELTRQTIADMSIVLYERSNKRAWMHGHEAFVWEVDSDEQLGATIPGKYAFVVPTAGISLPPTYLEMSLLALVGQELDFVCNVVGSPTAIERAIQAGRLPTGTDGSIVARAELFGSALKFDLSRLPERTYTPFAAGRVIRHDALEGMAAIEAWDSMRALGWNIILHDWYVIARPSHQRGWGTVPVVLRTIDSSIPAVPVPSDRPRMLVVFPFLAVGGAEQLTLDVLKRLQSDFDILCVTVEEKADELGSTVARYQQQFPHVYVLPNAIPSHLLFSAFTYLINRFAVQTLFVANGASWIYDATGGLRHTFPHLHMVNQVYDHRIGWIARYDPTLVHAYNRHIAPNQKIVAAYEQQGVAAERIDMIYHGIDTSSFKPPELDIAARQQLRSTFGLPPDRPVVTFAARIHPQKRPFDFVNVAQRFQPHEASFLIVGDGPLAEELAIQLEHLAMPHVHRKAFHTPFSDILAVSDVMVICSEYEGLPLVLLNAQSMGRPVVATDVGAIREVLEYTGGGVVIGEIGDIAAMERGIRQMLHTPPDSTTMHERTVERFDIQHVSQLYGASLTPRTSL